MIFFLKLISALLLISGCAQKQVMFSVIEQATAVNKHYVIGCHIYDKNFKVIKNFGVEKCIFLEDGSVIMSDPAQHQLAKYSADGEVVWKRKILTRHQLNLSENKKQLLVLAAEAVKEKVCMAVYSVLLILDAETGKTIARKSTHEFRKEFFQKSSPGSFYLIKLDKRSMFSQILQADCIASDMSSFIEIPHNKSATLNDAFKKGNFIVTDNSSNNSRQIFILDKNLKKIIWSVKVSPDNTYDFHNGQMWSDGKIIYSVGYLDSDNEFQTAIYRYDPILHKNELLFSKGGNPIYKPDNKVEPSVFSGSLQVLEDGYLVGHNYNILTGGQVLFFDKAGNISKLFSSRETDKWKDIAGIFEGVYQFDLSGFLKNNKM